MSSEQNKELQDLLKQAREYVDYFRELGAETIDSETAAPAFAAVAVRESKVPVPVAETIAPAREVPSAATASPLFARKPVAPTAPSAAKNLFGDEPTTLPSMPQSAETLEEIWRDIGECTRCGLCSGRTQVVNTHGNHKARLMFV